MTFFQASFKEELFFLKKRNRKYIYIECWECKICFRIGCILKDTPETEEKHDRVGDKSQEVLKG